MNPIMTLTRFLKWLAAAILALIILAALFIALFGWNWLRGPIERSTAEKTGRVLAIHGDLTVKFGWPWPRLRADSVTFANPDWAKEKQMLTADAVDITLDLSQLLRRKIVFPDVSLVRPAVFLEQNADGRKSWLLDRNQQDEGARIQIDRLTLDQGTLGYDDVANKIRIRSDFTTMRPPSGGATDAGVTFSASGQYKGLALQARGSGGPVLAIRDEHLPYALKIDASIGKTSVQANGTVTGLLTFSAVDVRMALRGESLDQLFPVLGIALPATPPYTTEGHLQHSGTVWRYEKFSGRVGGSDIAGLLQVDTSGKRPALSAEMDSKLLDLADLGPLIGSRPGSAAQAASRAAAGAAKPGRVLPDLPFQTDRWQTVDADVRLRAKTLRRAKELPLEDFATHLTLRDAVLKLEPLNFGLAGGQLNAVISLDGRQDPIRATAQIRVRKILLAQLFPTVELSKSSIGQVNGDFDLAGQGNSVGRMLASANGKVGLVVAGGEISKLMMEKVGLHLWEILQLSLTGDRQVKLRCAVVDFDVRNGRMNTDALIFDTEITTVIGTGSIDLGQETLDLTLNQKTKITSPLALRSPIYIRGSFAKPVVQVDTARLASRALGALALGLVNPLLALMPLIDAGPGKDSDCAQLVRDATALARSENKKESPRK
jgi:AsmA protein